MAKVRIIRQVGGLAGTAAALAAVGGIPLGCAAEQVDEAGTADQAASRVAPGSGSIVLHGYGFDYAASAGQDEFIRTGEKMVATLEFHELLYLFEQSQRDALQADPSLLTATLRVSYGDVNGATQPAQEFPVTWTPERGMIIGRSAEFTIPGAAPFLEVDFLVTAQGASFSLAGRLGARNRFPVFGAYLPNKAALFDTDNGGFRGRIVEGGDIVRASNPLISYTDWRADTVVDKTNLDRRYGRRRNYSRFGEYIVDAVGDLSYEVSAAVSVDGGATWGGLNLNRAQWPAVLQGQSDGRRVSYESTLWVPGSSQEVQLAFHVRAFLQVPSYSPGEVMDARYSPGSRILLADKWDNNGGQNYRLRTSGTP